MDANGNSPGQIIPNTLDNYWGLTAPPKTTEVDGRSVEANPISDWAAVWESSHSFAL